MATMKKYVAPQCVVSALEMSSVICQSGTTETYEQTGWESHQYAKQGIWDDDEEEE